LELFLFVGVGLFSGITTVVFGFGGGFIVVPVVYQFVMATEPQNTGDFMLIAVATSTAVMIFNACFTALKNYQSNLLDKTLLVPLIFYIGIGAIIGACISTVTSDTVLRVLFICYIFSIIFESLFRKSLSTKVEFKGPLTPLNTKMTGIFIGGVSSMLGVGGSILTVPVLRKRGYSMQSCVVAASALTIPVAIVGTCVYLVLGSMSKDLGSSYVGYVNVEIFAILSVFGFLGILFAKKYFTKIRDVIHAKIYMTLLVIVLIMVIV
tara:strand:+ start:49 stop:843 length:795 start_codon:yes stop_codon:yes gene_type:complete